MTTVLLGWLVIAAAVAVGLYVFWPRGTAPLGELLDTIERIKAEPESTAAQKRHLVQAIYEDYRRKTVSVVGKFEDVFPNGSAIIQTPLAQMPMLGFEFCSIKDAQLQTLAKGRMLTLRATLPPWKRFDAALHVVEVLGNARIFCDRRWYTVKNLYLAGSATRAPQDPPSVTMEAGINR